ncbi:hypothetical protein FALCPG4_008456 [Fusarium falciforme]
MDVNTIGGRYGTALQAASCRGYNDIVQLLLESEAAAEGHKATVKLLLKLGANSLLRDQGGWTALDESAPPGYDTVVRILIDHDAAILQSRDKRGKSALHRTVGQGHVSTVSLLLERGADVNATEIDGRSALFGAVRSGNKAIVEILLKRKADESIQDEEGCSVLHMAAYHGHVEVGEALIEAGTPISEGPEGILPLHIAALRRHIRFIECLLDHGANALAETESGANALHFLELNETYQAEAVA